MKQLCKHDWVRDDDCAYCRIADLEKQLAAAKGALALREMQIDELLKTIKEIEE